MPDTDTRRILTDPAYAGEVLSHGLTRHQTHALEILGRMYKSNSEPFSNEEKAVFERFMEASIGDMALNAKLKEAQKSSTSTLPTLALMAMTDFTWRTRGIGAFDAAYAKLQQAANPSSTGVTMSLGEFSHCYQLSRLTLAGSNNLKNSGLLAADSKLSQLMSKIEDCRTLVQGVESKFNTNFEFKPGSFVADVIEKKSEMYRTPLDHWGSAMKWIGVSSGHLSVGFMSEKKGGMAKLSHIDPTYQQEAFDLKHFLYSDVYHLNFKALIADDQQAALKKIYGDQWEDKVAKMYGKIEREIHDDQRRRFIHISASSSTQQVRSILPMRTTLTQYDFKQIHQEVMRQKAWEAEEKPADMKMLCSEFVAYTTIGAMQELDKQIREDAEQAEVTLNEGPVVKIPISPYEDLSKLYPERFLQVLNQAGVLQRDDQVLGLLEQDEAEARSTQDIMLK